MKHQEMFMVPLFILVQAVWTGQTGLKKSSYCKKFSRHLIPVLSYFIRPGYHIVQEINAGRSPYSMTCEIRGPAPRGGVSLGILLFCSCFQKPRSGTDGGEENGWLFLNKVGLFKV